MADTNYKIVSAPASPLTKESNSYNTLISLSQANKYLNVKPGNDNWTSLSNDEKIQYIIMATLDVNDILATICEKLFCDTDYNQYLSWPFKNSKNVDGTVTSVTSSTKFKDSSKLRTLKTYDIIDGSIVITNTINDNLAPQYECALITGYTEQSAEFTHEAFTTTLDIGDSYKLIYPCPIWLLICICEQILYRCNSLRHEGYADKFVSGISSEGGMNDKTIQLHDPGNYGHLCHRSASILRSLTAYNTTIKRYIT